MVQSQAEVNRVTALEKRIGDLEDDFDELKEYVLRLGQGVFGPEHNAPKA